MNRVEPRAVRHLWAPLVLLLLVGGVAAVPPPGSPENPYPVPYTDTAITVDGDLTEAAWQTAQVLELNYEVSPRENVAPPVRTEILFMYDRSNFYIGFRCYDPDPSRIRAYYSDRDALGSSDWVAVEIDTYNDSRRAFTLFSTPLGGQMDGISDAAGIKDYNWDMIYDTAGRVFDWGYGVEIAVPFSSLRFQRTQEEQTWGLNAVRGYPRDVSHQIWAQPYDRGNNCRVCQYTRIRGFRDVSPGRNVEINPTLTASTTEERTDMPAGDFANRDRQAEAGLSVRWGMTPNLMLSGTVNPDFSQVEADAAQLDINQPFALFFPEKRPFFTEGADFFRTPFNVVHTRTLRDPNWGVKLSGKEGANALGMYVVNDDITNLIFPGSQFSRTTSVDRSNMASVFRYSRDIRNNSSLGVLYTGRQGGDYSNHVFGVDGNLRFTDSDEVVFQYLGSRTRYEDSIAAEFGQPGGTFGGSALQAAYAHKTRRHTVEFLFEDVSRDFRADQGYVPQVGYRQYRGSSRHDWIPRERGWWSRLSLINEGYYSSDKNGGLLAKGLQNAFIFSGTYQSSVMVQHDLIRERYLDRQFTLSLFTCSASLNPVRFLWTSLMAGFGDGIDYANIRDGERFWLYPMISGNAGPHVELALSHLYERMNVAGERLYTAGITEGSAVYHFNDRTLVRAIVQYYDYDYNVANYLFPREPEYRRLFTQVLFSYKINPRTVLFLGFTDNHYGGPDYGLTRQNYTVFAKIGYAWVL